MVAKTGKNEVLHHSTQLFSPARNVVSHLEYAPQSSVDTACKIGGFHDKPQEPPTAQKRKRRCLDWLSGTKHIPLALEAVLAIKHLSSPAM